MRVFQGLMVIATACLAVACGDSESSATGTGGGGSGAGSSTFTLESPLFGEGEQLPVVSKCDRAEGGENASPPLSWSDPPDGTASYALTMHHYPDGSKPGIDTPSHYWLLWNIPSAVTSLETGNPGSVGTEGRVKDSTDMQGDPITETGYTPPCSPAGNTHEYTLTIYALSEAPASLSADDDPAVDWSVLTEAIAGTTLDTATLTFTDDGA